MIVAHPGRVAQPSVTHRGGHRHRVAVGDHEDGVRERVDEGRELLEVLRGLEHPARAAAQPLQGLEDLLQVGVARSLVAGQVVVPPGRDGGDGLEGAWRRSRRPAAGSPRGRGRRSSRASGLKSGMAKSTKPTAWAHRSADPPGRPQVARPRPGRAPRSPSRGAIGGGSGRQPGCAGGVAAVWPGACRADDGAVHGLGQDLGMTADEVLEQQPVAGAVRSAAGTGASIPASFSRPSWPRARPRMSRRSTKSSGPKSKSPVSARAAAIRASGRRSTEAPASPIMSRTARTSGLKRGSARSSMAIGAGRSGPVIPTSPWPRPPTSAARESAPAGTIGTRSNRGGARQWRPSSGGRGRAVRSRSPRSRPARSGPGSR